MTAAWIEKRAAAVDLSVELLEEGAVMVAELDDISREGSASRAVVNLGAVEAAPVRTSIDDIPDGISTFTWESSGATYSGKRANNVVLLVCLDGGGCKVEIVRCFSQQCFGAWRSFCCTMAGPHPARASHCQGKQAFYPFF